MFFFVLFCSVFVLFCSVLFLHRKDIFRVITDRKTGKLRKLLLADKTLASETRRVSSLPAAAGGVVSTTGMGERRGRSDDWLLNSQAYTTTGEISAI